MSNYLNNQKIYFGAANGYYGFRSNFSKIFAPDKLDRLFIIKGGPGTGKSTLMRKIKDVYSEKADVTSLLCSSDPDSFDGLLIKRNNVSIGVVDGTAPHVVEPEYPGATEEIVNLGEGFDFSRLYSSKREIISLTNEKKNNYKCAYDALRNAGSIYNYASDIFSNHRCYTEADDIIDVFNSDKSEKPFLAQTSDFLIGSFSKCGYKRLCICADEKEIILIKGDGISEYIFITQVAKLLKEKKLSYTLFPSAFSQDIPDAIETESHIYIITDASKYHVDTTEFVPMKNEYDRLKFAYKSLLESSQLALIKAAEKHFKLEAIYSHAMSFDKNDEKLNEILMKIDGIFDN